MEHRIVVMPPGDTGGRVVRGDNEILGTAYRMADLLEFLRRAGLDADVADPERHQVDANARIRQVARRRPRRLVKRPAYNEGPNPPTSRSATMHRRWGPVTPGLGPGA